MSLSTALNNLSKNSLYMTPAFMGALDIDLLRTIQIRGDFPTSLNLLENIKRSLNVESTTPESVAALVRADHVLSLRLIAIANYAYFDAGKSFHTVSGAVRHLGLGKIGEIVSDLSEAKNLNAIYLGRAVSMTMMQQAILASVIAEDIVRLIAPKSAWEEETYVVSALSNLGPLLLAYYKPNVYSGVCLECMDTREDFEHTFRKLMRKSIGEFGAAAAGALSLPDDYAELLPLIDQPPWRQPKWNGTPGKNKQQAIVTAVYMANLLAHEICYFTGVQGTQNLLAELENSVGLDGSALEDAIGTVADRYVKHTETLALKPVRMPEYLLWFAPTGFNQTPVTWKSHLPGINERINPFLYELRSCFKKRTAPDEFQHLSHAVYCTLNALVKGLNFDRAVFFRAEDEGRYLQLVVSLGVKIFQPTKVRRAITSQNGADVPDIQALARRSAVFTGEPIFPDGWPFVTFPVISGDKVIGLFYADKIRRPDGDALDSAEQISCVALAEEWHDLPVGFY